LLNNVNGILSIKPTARNNTINALIALSRFLGTYDTFMADLKRHGIKRYKPDPIQSFTRIFSSEAHKGLGEWYRQATLMQGRVGKSIFLHHYFKADPISLSQKILGLLPTIQESILQK
jgi:hypothetical protein